MEKKNFKVGEYVIYQNGDRCELGRVKKVIEDGLYFFVCYHEGETAARTPADTLYPLINAYAIKETTLGGTTFDKGD